MSDKKVELYDLFLTYSYQDVIKLFKGASSKAERDFYAKISDMILQKEQERIMGE